MSEGEAVALIHKVMMRIIMMIITEDGYIFINIDHSLRKLRVKLIKVKTAKFVRRGHHLCVPCCTLVFLFYILTRRQ